MNDSLGEYQCGFRKRRGVVIQIFALCEIQAESSECQVDRQHLLFIYVEQDRVLRPALSNIDGVGVNEKLVKRVKITLKNTENKAKINRSNRTSEKYPLQMGLTQ